MKIVITYGTFDVFHIGHLRLLKRAKKLGDKLIVGLSTDDFNKNMKNKTTEIPFSDRKEILESISCVDLVIPENSWEQKTQDILELGVDIFVIGDDWEGHFDNLSSICDVVYLERTPGISSSSIKEKIKNRDKNEKTQAISEK